MLDSVIINTLGAAPACFRTRLNYRKVIMSVCVITLTDCKHCVRPCSALPRIFERTFLTYGQVVKWSKVVMFNSSSIFSFFWPSITQINIARGAMASKQAKHVRLIRILGKLPTAWTCVHCANFGCLLINSPCKMTLMLNMLSVFLGFSSKYE